MTIKGSLLLSVPIVNISRFWSKSFSPTKIGPQNGGFSRNWWSKYHFLFSKPPKGTSLRGTASFDVFLREDQFWGLGCSLYEEPNKILAIANRSRVSCINTNNNTMTLKSGLEVTQCH